MTLMSQLMHEGEPVRANQFMYKAILLDTTMMMMQLATNEQVAIRIEMQLSQTFEKQISYCEDEKNHPFLEEVVSIYASYFESIGSYQNALLMWSKYLRI